jgi:hypothetical protein
MAQNMEFSKLLRSLLGTRAFHSKRITGISLKMFDYPQQTNKLIDAAYSIIVTFNFASGLELNRRQTSK